MATSVQRPPPFPDDDQILEFLRDNPNSGKREIARAFRLDAMQKRDLKKVLRRLQDAGQLQRGRGRRFREPDKLPEVTVIEVTGTDLDGEVLARPLNWDQDEPAPTIYMAPERRGHPALGKGDRVLARLKHLGPGPLGIQVYEGRTIRRLPGAPQQILGVFETDGRQGRIKPVDRRAKGDFLVAPGDAADAEPGDLVWAEALGGRKLGLRHARVVDRLGSATGPKSISLITIHDYDIPTRFSDDSMRQAEMSGPAPIENREDLRDLPLVTIDGADARDFDDAVWAEPDPDDANKGGWHLIVAIADVAWYVRPGDALDRSAYERGNSVYFPDRCIPMLPEALSTGWCSLLPREDRPVLAAHLWIDDEGSLLRHRFARAVMHSAARLTYTQLQAARDGAPDDVTAPLVDTVVDPLYGAFAALAKGRTTRGVLELDIPEKRILVDDRGRVLGVEPRARLDSHKLIEEFMICANVAAAETLERMNMPCMYRIHDEPSREKLEALREYLDGIGIRLAKGQVIKPSHFNGILARVADTPHEHTVNEVVLRSQAQAEYGPDNIGHFGLALRRYCHFTSPIRRYSDLLVHRALIRGGRLGEGGLEKVHRDFAEMGQHISATERRAAKAERDTVDRYVAAYLAERVGTTLTGRINGVTRFGLFVTLDESGGDGLVPIGTLGDDYFVHDERQHALVGRRTGETFRLGAAVNVVLAEADPVTGGLILALADGQKGATGSTKPRSAPRRHPPKARTRPRSRR